MTRRRSVWLIGLASLFASIVILEGLSPAVAAPGDLIARVSTDMARYEPTDDVTLTVEIDNQTGSAWSGTLYMDVSHLGTLIDTSKASPSGRG